MSIGPPVSGRAPECRGRIRSRSEDFVVDELLGFEPDDGPHWLLRVRKRDRNTADVARWLAAQGGVSHRDIGYCGLKDRHAVTSQFFSVPATPTGADPSTWAWCDDIVLLEQSRNRRKLRRGAHRGNRFTLVVRELDGDVDSVDEAARRVVSVGFPNYFGEQRFGREGGNPESARRLLAGGRLRRGRGGIEVSALRSLLFNRVLAARVADGSWIQAREHDLMILDGTGSFFRAADEEGGAATIDERLRRLDIHPSGPLWGIPEAGYPQALYRSELALLGELAADAELLEGARLEMGRRALRGRADDLEWRVAGNRVGKLSFTLGKGVFATALLRELIDVVGSGAAVESGGE